MAVSVLIADDHFAVRYGLEIITRKILGHQTQIDFAEGGDEILEKIKSKHYDILITDIIMRGMECRLMMESVLKLLPRLKILLVSVYPTEIFAPRYKKAGAYGYICKSDSEEELKTALRHIYLGKRYFPDAKDQDRTLVPKHLNTPFDQLSKREFSVMLQLLEGKGLNEIADNLALSPSTASTYRGRIFGKLNIKSLIELSNLARLYNIIIST